MSGFYVLMYHEIIGKEGYNRNNYKGIEIKQDYHDILPEELFCFKEEFEKQMEYLYENEYVTLTLNQVMNYYYNNKPIPEKSVLLTFDDAYKSILLNAYHILKKYNFHAVSFVVLDWIFDEPKEYHTSHSVCMSKEELQRLSDVFEFGNHTKSLHTREGMNTALQVVDKNTFLNDLKICEEYVTTKKVFAYPYGVYTKENIEWLKDFGTLLGFTSDDGLNTKETNPLELHRNASILQYSLDDFKKMLEM